MASGGGNPGQGWAGQEQWGRPKGCQDIDQVPAKKAAALGRLQFGLKPGALSREVEAAPPSRAEHAITLGQGRLCDSVCRYPGLIASTSQGKPVTLSQVLPCGLGVGGGVIQLQGETPGDQHQGDWGPAGREHPSFFSFPSLTSWFPFHTSPSLPVLPGSQVTSQNPPCCLVPGGLKRTHKLGNKEKGGQLGSQEQRKKKIWMEI